MAYVYVLRFEDLEVFGNANRVARHILEVYSEHKEMYFSERTDDGWKAHNWVRPEVIDRKAISDFAVLIRKSDHGTMELGGMDALHFTKEWVY